MSHIHEKIDFTVCIYIVFENKVLLHKHKVLGIWLPPGGHIELDEDPNEAAIREAKEETNLDVQLLGESHQYETPYNSRDLIMPRFLNRHRYDTKGEHEHVNFAFFARSNSADAKHEVAGGEIKWFSREDIDGNPEIVQDVQHQALTALDELA